MSSNPATLKSHQKLIAVEPVLNGLGRLSDFVTEYPLRTLYHAGPPYAATSLIPAPVLNSASAVAVMEGWAKSADAARAAIASHEIVLSPAQDIGLVTPLAFVAGPRTWCIEVVDGANPANRFLSPVNDGPPPKALRFGTGSAEGCALLKKLEDGIASELARFLRPRTPLIPLFADAIAKGDDLHGHLAALQSRLDDMFEMDQLSPEASRYLENANQFVLNIVMASTALMLRAGRGVDGSQMVTACGGNGIMLGYKVSGQGDDWIQVSAHQPIGQKFPQTSDRIALPAIGDSAVIDALGFGAANLRFCGTLQDALSGVVDEAFFTEAAHQPFIGPHPHIPVSGLRVGLDLARPRTCLGIMLGMVDADGQSGLIGRGVAHWPLP